MEIKQKLEQRLVSIKQQIEETKAYIEFIFENEKNLDNLATILYPAQSTLGSLRIEVNSIKLLLAINKSTNPFHNVIPRMAFNQIKEAFQTKDVTKLTS